MKICHLGTFVLHEFWHNRKPHFQLLLVYSDHTAKLGGGGDLSMKHHNMLLAHSSYVTGESEKILGHHPAVKDPTKVDLIPVQRTSTILRKL